MTNNDIEVIKPDSMSSIADSLEEADFSHNNINFSDYLTSTRKSPFQHCNKLKKLGFGYNKFTIIFDDWLNMTHLQNLNLQYNNIQGL